MASTEAAAATRCTRAMLFVAPSDNRTSGISFLLTSASSQGVKSIRINYYSAKKCVIVDFVLSNDGL